MANIELVIKIAEEAYQGIVNANKAHGQWGNDLLGILCAGIANGKLLPKGHGDLIDKNNLITITDISADGIEFTYVPYSEIEDAPTIIEADISGKEIER